MEEDIVTTCIVLATKKRFRICGGTQGINPDLRVEAVPLSHLCYVPARECLLQNRSWDDNVTYVLQT